MERFLSCLEKCTEDGICVVIESGPEMRSSNHLLGVHLVEVTGETEYSTHIACIQQEDLCKAGATAEEILCDVISDLRRELTSCIKERNKNDA